MQQHLYLIDTFCLSLSLSLHLLADGNLIIKANSFTFYHHHPLSAREGENNKVPNFPLGVRMSEILCKREAICLMTR